MSNERDTSPVITQDKLLEYHNNLVYPFLNGISTKGDQAFVPCGKIEGFMRTTAPKGYLVCDGTEYLKSAYPSLAAVLGAVDTAQSTTNFAGSDANHFKVPDLRGEFLRGSGTNSHADQGSGATVGTHQDATEHISYYSVGGSAGLASNAGRVEKADIKINKTEDKFFYATTTTTEGETSMKFTSRPTNTSVLYCIAYEDLYLTPRHTYSTDEQVVGTWIDGKPIYEKTLNFGNLPNAGRKEVAYDISNVERFINIIGISDEGNTFKNVPLVYNDGIANYNAGLEVNKNTGKIIIATDQDRSAFSAYITLQYTKTTD